MGEHSSTLVPAGVYLLIRFSECITLTSRALLMFLSTVTIFLSGLVANFEYDEEDYCFIYSQSTRGNDVLYFFRPLRPGFLPLSNSCSFQGLAFSMCWCFNSWGRGFSRHPFMWWIGPNFSTNWSMYKFG